MILNLWNGITFYCMNDHEEPVPLKVQQGESAFYACPRYFLFDNDHPDGHMPGEKACHNRISFRDAEGVVSELSKQIEEDMEEGCIADYTGLKLTYRHIRATVLKYAPGKIKIGILNRMAVEQ